MVRKIVATPKAALTERPQLDKKELERLELAARRKFDTDNAYAFTVKKIKGSTSPRFDRLKEMGIIGDDVTMTSFIKEAIYEKLSKLEEDNGLEAIKIETK